MAAGRAAAPATAPPATANAPAPNSRKRKTAKTKKTTDTKTPRAGTLRLPRGAFVCIGALRLQRAGGKAVPAQHLHLGVAQGFELGGGFLKPKGQRLALVGVGRDDEVAGQRQPVFEDGVRGEEILPETAE